jgi:sugar lactone lactonase YvrE
VTVASANGGANSSTTVGSGVVPQAEINTLADILQDCVNSNGATVPTPPATVVPACGQLYAATTPPSATGLPAPTNTWGAALNIARYPANNASTLFGLVSSNAAFQPTIGAAPADWAIGISWGGLTGVQQLAIDGSDDVYIVQNSGVYATPPAVSTYGASVVELSGGVETTTNLSYNASSSTLSLFTDPTAIVADKAGNIWVTNGGAATVPTAKGVYGPANSNVVFELPSGNKTPVVTQTVGYDDPQSVQADAAGDIWIGNGAKTGTIAAYGLSELVYTAPSTYAYTATFGSSSIKAATTGGCTGIAIDSSNNVYCSPSFYYKIFRFASPYTAAPTALSFTAEDPDALAFDASGNLWVAGAGYSTTPGSLTSLSASTYTSGTTITQSPYEGLNGMTTTTVVGNTIVDGMGNIWWPDETSNGVHQFNPTIGTSVTTGTTTAPGTPLSESGGFTASGLLTTPNSIAVDEAGALWVSNLKGSSVIQILGTAAPTEPVQADLKYGVYP